MKKTLFLLAAAFLISTESHAEWKMNEFMIALWGGPMTSNTEECAKALSQSNFNVVMWDANTLDACNKYGLKSLITAPTPEIAAKVKDHPAIWGYHCGDEPYPEEQFLPIVEQFKAIKNADPNHPAFINMLSTTGEFLRTYMEKVKPEILSYDYYQWWWGSDRYFEKLEQFREAAILAGVPFACCIETDANPGRDSGASKIYLEDNAVKLRQSVYTTLAYGAKGVEWFNSGPLFEPKSVKLTRWGKDIATLNAEMKNIGPTLVNLKSLDVFNTPPLNLGTREAPKEYWVHLIGDEGCAGLVQGMFKDSTGLDYMLVANRDYRSSQPVVVRFQSKWLGIAPWHKKKTYSYKVERIDKNTGKWITISGSSAVGFTFVIDKGDGELFRITTNIEKQ